MSETAAGPVSIGRDTRRGIPAIVLMSVLAAVICGHAATVGAYPVSLSEALAAIGARLTGASTGTTAETVLIDIRLPRILAGLVVGAALAAAGAVYQGLFRNPLVSPDILGVSTGAGLGAVLGIFLSVSIFLIQLFAFAGGLITVALVYLIATRVRGRETTLVLVLSGVVIGALAGALISLLKVMADPYDQLPAITFWLLGSLASVRHADILSVLPAVLIGLVPLVLLRWRITVLSLGDDEARTLGVDAGRMRVLVIAAATLMTSAVVAISGVIGWVGLIMPHIARMIVGPNFSLLLPASMLMGAGYLVLVDTMARSIGQVETPLGILTAIVGAPFFLWLLARGRHGWSG